MGHSKFINSIDYRPSRPFRVATAGEDNLVCWFEGPPFRYKQTLKVFIIEEKHWLLGDCLYVIKNVICNRCC